MTDFIRLCWLAGIPIEEVCAQVSTPLYAYAVYSELNRREEAARKVTQL